MSQQEKWSSSDYKTYMAGSNGAHQKGSAKRNKKEEGNLSSVIEQWLSFNGFENDRINSGSVIVSTKYQSKKTLKTTEHTRKITLAKPGTPDRWALHKGIWILIETKLKGGKPSDIQLDRQKDLAKAGARIINADSFESFLDQFQTIKTKIDGGL